MIHKKLINSAGSVVLGELYDQERMKQLTDLGRMLYTVASPPSQTNSTYFIWLFQSNATQLTQMIVRGISRE